MAGSWARGLATASSDLDLMILTSDLEGWTCDVARLSAQLAHLGLAIAAEPALETYGVASSWRFRPMPAIELELTFVDLSWANIDPVDPGTLRVANDGLVTLIDKDGRLGALATSILLSTDHP